MTENKVNARLLITSIGHKLKIHLFLSKHILQVA